LIFIKKYDIIYIESERKEMINMTRETALAVTKALENIDGFEAMVESIDAAVRDAEEWCNISPDFKLELENLMQSELMRLKSVLEEM
jgi:hypothetical protein